MVSASRAAAGPPSENHAASAVQVLTARSAALPAADGPQQLGDLLLDYLRRQYRELLSQDPRVRAGEDDAVHKMRVATRRMRSALAGYGSVLAEQPALRLRGELRWIAGALGQVRDPQVMHGRFRALLSAQAPELVVGGTARRIDEELLAEQAAARAQLLELLAGQRYGQLLQDLETLLRGPQRQAAAAGPAGRGGRDVVRRQRRRLKRHVKAALAAAPAGDGTGSGPAHGDGEEALHTARKAAKRLRYSAEVWAGVDPGPAGKVAAAAERLQKILGEHQDAVVAAGYLRTFGASGARSGVNAFTFGRLHAVEQQRAAAARREFEAAWADFPKVR